MDTQVSSNWTLERSPYPYPPPAPETYDFDFLRRVPKRIQCMLYQALIVELEECCTAYAVKHGDLGKSGDFGEHRSPTIRPGSRNLKEVVDFILREWAQSENRAKLESQESRLRDIFGNSKDEYGFASAFRHMVIHRSCLHLNPYYAEVVCEIPRILNDEVRHQRVTRLFETIKNAVGKNMDYLTIPEVASFVEPKETFPHCMRLCQDLVGRLERSAFEFNSKRRLCELPPSSSFEEYDLGFWTHGQEIGCDNQEWGKRPKGILPATEILWAEYDTDIFHYAFKGTDRGRNVAAHGDEGALDPWCLTYNDIIPLRELVANFVEAALAVGDVRTALEMEVSIQAFGRQIPRDDAYRLLDSRYSPSYLNGTSRAPKEVLNRWWTPEALRDTVLAAEKSGLEDLNTKGSSYKWLYESQKYLEEIEQVRESDLDRNDDWFLPRSAWVVEDVILSHNERFHRFGPPREQSRGSLSR